MSYYSNMPDYTSNLPALFGLYNAIVTATDGTQILWNATMGFKRLVRPSTFVEVSLERYPEIQAKVDAFVASGQSQSASWGWHC